MSNETGEEIYLEYIGKFLKIRNLPREDRVQLNKEYRFEGESCYEFKAMRTEDCADFINLASCTYLDSFKRAPKTQMINGHEVVAPRYDSIMNCTNNEIFVFSSSEKNGVCRLNINLDNTSYRSNFGWFNAYDVCLAYANAHRESK